jgi:hypothetical protein
MHFAALNNEEGVIQVRLISTRLFIVYASISRFFYRIHVHISVRTPIQGREEDGHRLFGGLGAAFRSAQ